MQIVITGGIGCGKSTVTEILKSEFLQHYQLYDYDKAVHQLYENKTVQSELYMKFGTHNRRELSKHAFADKKNMLKMKEIFKPYIQRQIIDCGKQDDILLDIPVWYEYHNDFGILPKLVINVSCSPDIQLQRVIARDTHRPLKEIQQILAAQIPLKDKIEMSQHTIYTDPGIDVRASIRRILQVEKITTGKSSLSPQI
jgi:dephospho-CoA kinase